MRPYARKKANPDGDDSDVPGDPNMTPPSTREAVHFQQSREGAEHADETEPAEMLGVPHQSPADARAVDASESLFEKRMTEEDLQDLAAASPDASSSLAGVMPWERKGVLWLLVFCLAGLTLLVLVQLLSLVRQLRELPPWLSTPAFVAAGILILLMVFAAGRLLLSYARMRANSKVTLRALKELDARGHLRQQASAGLMQARTELQRYIREHPLNGRKGATELLRLGFDAAQVKALNEGAQWLLHEELTTCDGWFRECDLRFLRLLDDGAKRRINRYAVSVGWKTAAVPTGFADTSIVLYNTYLMIGDLCRIYNLRANAIGTLAIMVRVMINAFAAGHMETWSESAVNTFFGEAVHGGAGALVGVAKGLLSRAAEGAANGLLFRRLGLATIRQLRPVDLRE